MVITKTLKFIILIGIFAVYLLWTRRRLRYTPEFRDFDFWADKILLVLITAVGYYLGISIKWIAAFFFVFMSILIWMDSTTVFKDSSGGASIQVIHPYETNPEKKDDQLKKAIIPLHIYQTWHTKWLPPQMTKCVDRLKRENPEFTHHLFDDADCRKYIQNYFDADVLYAYDHMVPGAYKADLWRYCVLYKDGGIYMDIKLQCEPQFKLLELVDKEHFVLDRPYIKTISLEDELAWIQSPNYSHSVYYKVDPNIWENGNIGMYNAFMVCKAGNPILKECIDIIVRNTKKKNYGYNQLYPTGPGLLGNVYFRGNREKIHTIDLYNSLNGDCILSREKKIISHYPEYRKEQKKNGTKHYHELWEKRKIYVE